VAQRVLLALVGGYVLTAEVIALGAFALAALGMARSEAVTLGAMMGFPVYLALLIWAFSERRLLRLWMGLGGGALAASVLTRALPLLAGIGG